MQARTFGALAVAFVFIAPAPSCAPGAAEPYMFDGGDDPGSDGSAPGAELDGGNEDTSITQPEWNDTGSPANPGDDASGGNDAFADSFVADTSTTDSSPATPNDAQTGGPPPTGLSVLYQVEDSSAMSAYIGCELSVLNSSTASPSISNFKVRYYYTDEVHQTPQMTINWSHVSTSGADQDLEVTSATVALTPAATDADTYIEFSLASGSSPTLAPGDAAQFSWQMQGPSPAQDVYTQTNDYSFDSSLTTLTSWNHVVLLESGTVVWGVTP
jgi:hypothetical protein